MQPLLGPDLWHREIATDLACEAVGDLCVSQHRLNRTGLWIAPQGMGTSLTLEITSVPPQMLEQTAPLAVYLHPAADKYHRLTRRPSQGQEGLEERALIASRQPSAP
jgi:hypothetical protein